MAVARRVRGGVRRVLVGVRRVRGRAAPEDGAEPIEFGRPDAGKQYWERFAGEARSAWRSELEKDAPCALTALLHVAAEDDAIKSRSSVRLPVEAYTKRVDKFAAELARRDLPAAGGDAQEQLEVVERYVVGIQKYRVATLSGVDRAAEEYGPYRLYAHNVLAQKVGAPASIAAVYLAVLSRLRAADALAADIEVLLPPDNRVPELRVATGDSSAPLGWAVCTPEMIVREVLKCLKRAYWPWLWRPSAASGFLSAAEAATGLQGRVGSTAAGTVIQASGRPFGDLTCARLACERLVEMDGEGSVEGRDLGVLLYHLQEYSRAQDLLTAYTASNGILSAPPTPDGLLARTNAGLQARLEEDALMAPLMDKVQRKVLEESLARS